MFTSHQRSIQSVILAGLAPAALLSLTAASPQAPRSVPKVDFARDIQPILANNCLECHGADEHARKASLRLDTFSGATQKVVVPGSSAKSPLIARVTAD